MPPLLLKIAGIVAIYFLVAGQVMALISNRLDQDPWENPGPILGGLFWPVILPIFLGYCIIRKREEPFGDDKKNLPKAKVVKE